MDRSHYRVAIVGAGPSGASCAVALATAGERSVALIDRAGFPRQKARGDFIGPGAAQVLRLLGLEGQLTNHAPTREVTVSGPDGISATLGLSAFDRTDGLGYVIGSRVFDTHLVEGAFEHGVADLTGWCMDLAVHTGGRWEISLSRTGDTARRQLTADFLVGADGAQSKVRAALGIPSSPPTSTGVAVHCYARVVRQQGPIVRFDFIPEILNLPGHGWVCVNSESVANVGVVLRLCEARSIALKPALDSYLDWLGSDFTETPGTREIGTIPVSSDPSRPFRINAPAALIGDAGSMAPTLFGEGLFFGMHAGMHLGQALAEATIGGRDGSAAADACMRHHDDAFRQHYRNARLLYRIFSSTRLMTKVVAASNRDPALFRDYVEIVRGHLPHEKLPSIPALALRTLAARPHAQAPPEPQPRSLPLPSQAALADAGEMTTAAANKSAEQRTIATITNSH